MSPQPQTAFPVLVPSGIDLGDGPKPLISGAIHYFRVAPEYWRGALMALQEMGVSIVDTALPWSLYQQPSGEIDFHAESKVDPREFLSLVHELGMQAVVRVGPSLDAGLDGAGMPHEILWDAPCQARSPNGEPVMVPALPRAFPRPSLSSASFLDEAKDWLLAVATLLHPLAYPRGPVVLVAVDGTSFSKEGVYDADYHPDSIVAYRHFVERKYGSLQALRDAYGDGTLAFETLRPPERLSATTRRGLLRHLDWVEHREEEQQNALQAFRLVLEENGLSHLPIACCLPRPRELTTGAGSVLSSGFSLVGHDYRLGRDAHEPRCIARITGELSSLAAQRRAPAWASDLPTGFAPFARAVSSGDTHFSALAALACGVNAFSLHMAVARDFWIGTPINSRGEKSGDFEFWQRLIQVFELTKLYELRRQVAVRLCIPQSYQRLCRALGAFGSAANHVVEYWGFGEAELATEEDVGFQHPVVSDTERFLSDLELELVRQGVPFTYATGQALLQPFQGWDIVLCPGFLERPVIDKIQGRLADHQCVSFGPHDLVRDENLDLVTTPFAPGSSPALWLGTDQFSLRAAVETFARERESSWTPFSCDQNLDHNQEESGVASSPRAEVTFFEDGAGELKVVFAMNGKNGPVTLRFPSQKTFRDAFSREILEDQGGWIHCAVPARTVRVLTASELRPLAPSSKV